MKELKKKAALTKEARELLTDYSYPGNIRELKYIIELALLKATDGYIHPEHLPDSVHARKSNGVIANSDENQDAILFQEPTGKDPAASRKTRLDDQLIFGVEVSQVLSKLQECRGSRRSAARELGVSERKLYRVLKRCEELGLVVPKPYQIVPGALPEIYAEIKLYTDVPGRCT